MKKIFALLSFVASVLTMTAQPLLVGHRGSYWGVENTAEAFINGAKKGYHYLECDVKVTSDGVHVLTHDDSSSRMGGSLTIASSTLAQLKAETYTQTRGGITYTGQICTLSEYLAICKEYNVKPVIELKWATGINSNDCSGIPALIKVIEQGGFRNTCVILTSMKPCLEYIRKNYPDVTLQFLTGQYWANHFDWCVEWGIDVDIESGYFDKSTVEKFHEAGLKVNMWTANTAANYKTYGNYGCDFITTDYLNPAELPELDASITFPPNTIDYPKVNATVQDYFYPDQILDTAPQLIPESVAADRALLRNGKWYVLTNSLAGGNSSEINIYDAKTGQWIKKVNTTGVNGGDDLISDIAFSADGILLGCNKATMGNGTWKIYKWANDDATPQVYSQIDKAPTAAKWTDAVLGESFAVSGRLNDLQVYTLAYSASATNLAYEVAGFKMTNGTASQTVFASNAAYTAQAWGKPQLMVTPSSRDNVLLTNTPSAMPEFTFDWSGNTASMIEYDKINDASISSISFLRFGSRVLAYSASVADGKMTTVMHDATDSIGNLVVASPTLLSRNAPEGYFTTAMELADGCINLYTYADNKGFSFHKVAVDYTSDQPVAEADFYLELLWENSLNKGNAPQHIDGTNAQQGGAANGRFYVNDCADEKIYIFDQTGCLGSIPGGKGWGCALDDAGNIIVRNDKDTGTEHSFIIYPAGASVENPGTPVSLKVTVPLDGQTNFISASGDVLGKGGNIYMWPNAKTAINIITMENGTVSTCLQSQEVSIKGSTAGIVIPINNNRQNWMYQVRSNGYYLYNGGDNVDILAGRGTTTAPARNNTVGGEYFTLSGHKIFIHNSGAHYLGGFTVRDLTADQVITSVDPIGNMGYVTGGNYSVANWLFAEKINDSSCYIYQYCPANGMAMYRLVDRKSSIESIASSATNSLKVYPNPATTVINVTNGSDLGNLTVYSMTGAQMAPAIDYTGQSNATIDISAMPTGIYFVHDANTGTTAKFIKK